MELGKAVINRLKENRPHGARVEYFAELVQKTESQIKVLRGIGKINRGKIDRCLADMGLRLGIEFNALQRKILSIVCNKPDLALEPDELMALAERSNSGKYLLPLALEKNQTIMVRVMQASNTTSPLIPTNPIQEATTEADQAYVTILGQAIALSDEDRAMLLRDLLIFEVIVR